MVPPVNINRGREYVSRIGRGISDIGSRVYNGMKSGIRNAVLGTAILATTFAPLSQTSAQEYVPRRNVAQYSLSDLPGMRGSLPNKFRVADEPLTDEQALSTAAANEVLAYRMRGLSTDKEFGRRKQLNARWGKPVVEYFIGRGRKGRIKPVDFSNSSYRPGTAPFESVEADAIAMANAGLIDERLGNDHFNPVPTQTARTALDAGNIVVEGNAYILVPVGDLAYFGVDTSTSRLNNTRGTFRVKTADGSRTLCTVPIAAAEYTCSFDGDSGLYRIEAIRPRGGQKFMTSSQLVSLGEGYNPIHMLLAPRHEVFTKRKEDREGVLQEPPFYETNVTHVRPFIGAYAEGLKKPLDILKVRGFGERGGQLGNIFRTRQDMDDFVKIAMAEAGTVATGLTLIDYGNATDPDFNIPGTVISHFDMGNFNDPRFSDNFEISNGRFGGPSVAPSQSIAKAEYAPFSLWVHELDFWDSLASDLAEIIPGAIDPNEVSELDRVMIPVYKASSAGTLAADGIALYEPLELPEPPSESVLSRAASLFNREDINPYTGFEGERTGFENGHFQVRYRSDELPERIRTTFPDAKGGFVYDSETNRFWPQRNASDMTFLDDYVESNDSERGVVSDKGYRSNDVIVQYEDPETGLSIVMPMTDQPVPFFASSHPTSIRGEESKKNSLEKITNK